MSTAEIGYTTRNSQKTTHVEAGDKAAGKNMTHQIITTEQEFHDLKWHWQELARRTHATIFMTHEWAATWWHNFGKNSHRSLYILCFWNEDELIGLAPFFAGITQIGSTTVEKRLQLLGSGGSPNEQLGFLDDYGISDFLDVLALPEYRAQIADKICRLIQSGKLETDAIHFHQIRDDSFILNQLYPALQKTKLELSLTHTDTCPYIDLDDMASFDAYLKSLKSSARRRFRQSLKAIHKTKELKLLELKNWDEIETAIDRMIALHQERWNRLGFPGVFYDKRFEHFFRETMRYAFDNGWLWLREIEDEDGVCASRMLLMYNGSFYDYISGFNDLKPSSKYRPGIGLLVEAVRDAIARKLHTVELLRGEEGYKFDFTDKTFRNWKLTVLSAGEKSNGHGAVKWCVHAIARAYKRGSRELRLMNVQKQQHGFLKMLPQYINFRVKGIFNSK